jgi:hypothetical protein
MAGRTVIVGDVHGCFDELTDLFEKVRLQPADHLVMIGDTVVKGPKPREVLRCVLARPRTTCLLGNMEWRLLEACDRGLQHRLPRAHLETLQTLQGGWDEIEASMRTWPLTLDLGDVLCIHAGLRPGRSLAEQTLHDLLHLRRVKVGGVCGPTTAKPWWELHSGPPTVVFGHSVLAAPLVTRWTIGIDTGCVYGGHLTAITLPDREIIQVPARATHFSIVPRALERRREIA